MMEGQSQSEELAFDSTEGPNQTEENTSASLDGILFTCFLYICLFDVFMYLVV